MSMSSPRERKRGRPVSIDGMVAEARVQAYSISYELARHDQWELAALESVDLLLAEGDVVGARRVVADLRVRDVRVENPLHREITDVFEESGRAVAS